MLTAIDSSVLLDVLTNSAAHADSSEQALRKAAGEGWLIICECVLAEIRPAFATSGQADEFLGDWELRFVPSSRESALLAGLPLSLAPTLVALPSMSLLPVAPFLLLTFLAPPLSFA
jgi:hypothetical protein